MDAASPGEESLCGIPVPEKKYKNNVPACPGKKILLRGTLAFFCGFV